MSSDSFEGMKVEDWQGWRGEERERERPQRQGNIQGLKVGVRGRGLGGRVCVYLT